MIQQGDAIRNPILSNELVIDNPAENFLILLVSFLPTTAWVLYPVFTSVEYPLYPEYMNAAGVVEIVNGTPFFAATLLISSFQFSGTQNLQLPSVKAMKKFSSLVGLSETC